MAWCLHSRFLISRRVLQLLLLALALGSAAQAGARPGRATPPGMPRSFQMDTVKVKGRQYYRTFRVTSPKGFKRITDSSNPCRFFNGSGQYGEGYYLFRTRRDARRFVRCETLFGSWAPLSTLRIPVVNRPGRCYRLRAARGRQSDRQMDIEIDSAADQILLSTLREGKLRQAAGPAPRAARAPRITDSLHRRFEVLATSL